MSAKLFFCLPIVESVCQNQSQANSCSRQKIVYYK